MYKRCVIGVDPGKTTGIFAWHYLDRASGFPNGELVAAGDWHHVDAEDFPKVMRRLLHVEYARLEPVIAVERFIINARTARLSQQPEALEITGMVRALAALDGFEVRQYLKSNLKFAKDDALRRAGWYLPNMRHANDAARQAFALLKDVDYPLWCRVSEGGIMKIDDERT